MGVCVMNSESRRYVLRNQWRRASGGTAVTGQLRSRFDIRVLKATRDDAPSFKADGRSASSPRAQEEPKGLFRSVTGRKATGETEQRVPHEQSGDHTAVSGIAGNMKT
ncbi:hypothetical protein EYF80_056365 [Liparis tanakae]|uniref:Uncharacterized protein n=1 Tax=Liparis tanakae TaxID=230148 RepID=A0A4Z2EXD9_9TELE|nr:hypothetical protein EYF80_056365 [Liparis tanakae]